MKSFRHTGLGMISVLTGLCQPKSNCSHETSRRWMTGWVTSALAATLVAGMTARVEGANGSRTSDVDGLWTNTVQWLNGQVAGGAGSTAWFTNNITATRTVTIDTAQTNAILNVGDGGTTYYPFSFVPASGGTLTFDNGGATAQFNQTATAAAQTFGVPVVLASPLVISNASANGLTFTNGITGTGNLTLTCSGGQPITITNKPVDIVGTITNAGISGRVYISGGVGANVKAIVHKNSVSTMLIDTLPILVNSTGTLVANNNNSGSSTLTVSGGVGGTGDLVLQNMAVANGITVSGASITNIGNLAVNANGAGAIAISAPVNNSGIITNSGTGSGTVTLSGGVGPNVTAIVANATNSALTITLPLKVNNNGTTLANNNSSGTKQLYVNTSVGGTGDLMLQNNSAIGDGVHIGNGVSITNMGMLINCGMGPSNAYIYGNIGPNVTMVVQNSTNSALILEGTHSFTNGLWIKAGTVKAQNSGGIGASTSVITLGDTNGSADATLEFGSGAAVSSTLNPILVSSGNTGVATINNLAWSGPITLSNHALTVSQSGATAVSFSGGFTGVGDLTFKYNGTAAGDMLKITTVQANHNGKIINAGTGPGTCKIEVVGVGSNVTAIIEDSTNSPLTIYAGVLMVHNNGTTLANLNSSGTQVFTVGMNSGRVAGIGNLVLSNNSAIANGIWVQATVTNIGRVINSGTGSGDVLVSGVIGTNVTGVLQDSATSRLVLSGANTLGGTTVVTNGALKVDGSLGSSNAVLVYTNGILQGSGTIRGTNTVYAGGMVSPGPETTAGGTLTIGNLVWSDGGIYKCQITNIANNEAGAGTDYDQIVVTGTLTNAPGQKFILRLDSMGQALTFRTNQNYSLKVITCGTETGLSPADVTLDTSAFLLSDSGTWMVTNVNKSIYVYYRADPLTGKNYWRGSTNGSLWSVDANWSLGHAPLSGEQVEFDFLCVSNCTADVVSDNLGSLTICEGYGGTVTVQTVYQPTGFTNVSIAGDCTINGGVLTHPANSGGETNRLRMTVNGNLVVANGAIINAVGRGYAAGKGPGAGVIVSAGNDGGAYGGMSGYGNAKVYGSIVAPTNLGSGGVNGGGGGAIELTVAGTTTVNSASVLDAAANPAGGGAGGAGGSVFLTTGWLTGSGTIRANGRSNCGGGGRVAIVLTGAGADFSNWSGANQAFGGWTPVSGAGTVYRRTAAGVDTLIIDNNNATDVDAAAQFNWGPFGHIATLMPSDVDLHSFSNVLIRNKGVLGIKGDTTVNFGTFAPTVYGATNSLISINTDTNVTYPADWTISGYTLFPNNISTSRLVNITVETNSAISPIKGSATGLNLSIPGNLTVRGKIDADGRGYAPPRNGNGKGIGSNPYTGAAYGGGSLYSTTLLNTNTYGSILAPVDIGSSGEHGAGGGLILLNVGGTTTVASAGMISANAWGHNYDSQGSGGSVNLRTGWLTGVGTIRANGTTSTSPSSGSGGGGRVAVVLTGAGADFATWTGTNTASGGGGTYQAAAGTVYRQAAGVADGAGTVLVNNGATATNATFTSLPAFLNQSENLNNTSWMTTNTVRLGLTTNSSVASLTLNANGSLELAGWTLTVNALTATNKSYRSGTYTPAEINLLTDRLGGGKLVVDGSPTVTVASATAIGIGAATLNGGVIETKGLSTTFFFLWGTNDFGTNATSPWTAVNCGMATNGQAFSTNLTGLIYGQQYWYYTYASNVSGEAWSFATNFLTTTDGSSGLANNSASSITAASAVLSATLTATNTYHEVYAYWGPTDGTNNPAAWPHSAYVGAFTLSGATTLSNITYTATSGLNPGQSYWYTFRYTNACTNLWASPSTNFTTPIASPIVTVAPASGLGVGVATLNGTLTSDGGTTTTAYLCWGTNDYGTGSTAPWNVIDCGAATNGQALSANLTGLIYGVRYWYRAYATNASGVGWSSSTNLLTTAPDIAITNTCATNVTATAATLTGTLTGSNSYFEVWAQWGATDGTTNAAAWTNTAYVGAFLLTNATTSSNISYTASSGLSAGQTYWYTLRGTNACTNLWASPSKSFGYATVTLGNLTQTYNNTARTTTVTTVPAGLSVLVTYNGSSAYPTNAGSYAVTCTVSDATFTGQTNGTLIVSPAALTIAARAQTKVYGTLLTNAVNYTFFTTNGLANNEQITSVTVAYTNSGALATNAVGVYTNTISLSEALGAGGFDTNNYTITYVPTNLTVNPATLTIAAVAQTKTYGVTLTNATGYTSFTTNGLLAGEAITSVSVAYTNGGHLATDAAGVYTNTISLSLATGSGGFNTNNYAIAYVPTNLTVTALLPAVTVSAATSVGVGVATINGTLTSDGGATTTVYFFWGTNDFGGSSTSAWPNAVSFGTKTSGQSVSANLTGLLYGQRYWYCAYATNAIGDAWSSPTNFLTTVVFVSATGGTVTNYTDAGGTNWTAHIFTSGVPTNLTVTAGGAAEVLVVGGGGGGGNGFGGGGGAGGYRYVYTNLTTATNTVVVGGGGAAGPSSNTQGSSGTNSSFDVIVAAGGGGGGGGGSSATTNSGLSGGSGGGATGAGGTPGNGNTPSTSPSQGNNGANGSAGVYGGGGGGAGSAGSTKNGGSGVSNAITGTLVGYCGGGAGIAAAGLGTASEGGGGTYGSVTNSAAANTGGGGMGRTTGGNGGSGIVVVRYVAGGSAVSIGITNNAATAVQATQATLNGTLTGSNSYFELWAYWGQTDGTNNADGLWAHTNYVGAYTLSGATTSSNIAYTATTGIAAGQGYWYTFRATNACTSIWASPSTNFTAGKLSATVTLGNLAQTYNGTSRTTTVTTAQAGLSVLVTYNGSAAYPTNAGSYAVTGTVSDAVYAGQTNGTLIVSPAPLIITAVAQTKEYGTLLTNAAGYTAFTTNGLVSGEVIESVSVSYTNGGALATSGVGTYTNTIALAGATGSGGFDTNNYAITYVPTNLVVTGRLLTITADSASKEYDGTALTTNAAQITSGTLAGGDTLSSVTGTGARTAVGTSANVPSAAVITNALGTDVTGNYQLTYSNGTLTVTAKALTLTATEQIKVYGTQLTNAAGYTAFTTNGLVSGESIESVSVSYTNGGALAMSGVGTYTNTIALAGATGSGGFDTNNYAIAYVPTNLVVTKAQAVIAVSGTNVVYDGAAHGASGTATGAAGENLAGLLSLGAVYTNVPGGIANWSFAGDANHVATNGAVSIVIGQAEAVLAVSGTNVVYDGAAHGASGTATGAAGEPLTGLLNLGAVYTNVPGGTANWSFTGDANHVATNGSVSIVIGQAQAVLAVSGTNVVYDGAAHGASGTATGAAGEPLTGLLNLGAVYTNVPGGTANWSFAGDANHVATNGAVSIVISQAGVVVVVWPVASSISNGQSLAGSVLSGGVVSNAALTLPVPGTFSFTNASLVPGPGACFTAVTFAPDAMQNYCAVTGGWVRVNRRPVAFPDAGGLRQERSISISVGKLLNNDTDLDGDTLVITNVQASSHGGVVALVSGTVTYTNAGFAGTDTFTYVVCDGAGGCATGTVTVVVSPAADGAVSLNIVGGPSLEGGVFVVRFAGIPGYTYTAEYTTNLTPAAWYKKVNLIAPVTNEGLGAGVFELQDATTDPQRYYRTVWPPY